MSECLFHINLLAVHDVQTALQLACYLAAVECECLGSCGRCRRDAADAGFFGNFLDSCGTLCRYVELGIRCEAPSATAVVDRPLANRFARNLRRGTHPVFRAATGREGKLVVAERLNGNGDGFILQGGVHRASESVDLNKLAGTGVVEIILLIE